MIDTTRKYYLAGPMSGIPQFNVPMFQRVAGTLRRDGLDVTSPAELDSDKMREAALRSEDGNAAAMCAEVGETWGDCLARDVKLIADELDDIVLLPGWYKSRGACLEATVGLLQSDCRFYIWNGTDKRAQRVSRRYVADHVALFMREQAGDD